MRNKRLFDVIDPGYYTNLAVEIQKQYSDLTKKILKKHKDIDAHDLTYIANAGVTFATIMQLASETTKRIEKINKLVPPLSKKK